MKKHLNNDGYESFPKSDRQGNRILIHKILAENMFGGVLPADNQGRVFVVHHINRVKTDNHIDNLMVLSNSAHIILHADLRAIDAGFPEQYRRCCFCNKYDAPNNLKLRKLGNRITGRHHPKCNREYSKKIRERHPERAAIYARRYMERHPEKYIESQRKYKASHRELLRLKEKNRRLAKKIKKIKSDPNVIKIQTFF
jgi:hypothetical protein